MGIVGFLVLKSIFYLGINYMEEIIENVTIDSLLSEVQVRSCLNYFEIFARESKITPDTELKNKFELLRDITSLQFNFDEYSVFDPLFHFKGVGVNSGLAQTSPTLEDINEDKIQLLSIILNETNDPELKARIADILQHKSKRDRVKYAETAVGAYINSINYSALRNHECLDRYKRLAQLAKKYKKGNTLVTEKIIQFFIEKIECAVEQNLHYNALELLEIFVKNDLIPNELKNSYTDLCYKIINTLEEKNHWRAAEVGYEIAIQFFSSNEQKNVNHLKLAVVCEKISQMEPSVRKLDYMRKAIENYRISGSISNKEKIELLESQLPELTSQVWAGNMHQYQVTTDITSLMNSVQSSLSNTTLRDKLAALASIDNFLSRTEAISLVRSSLENTITGTAIAHIYDSNFNLQHCSRNHTDDTTIQELFLLKSGRHGLRAGLVDFVRKKIMDEHNPDFSDIQHIYINSAWVPSCHITQISRGIIAGFNGHWMTCALFLLPIFETMLGAFLNSKGISNIKCNSNHTQENKSLDELLKDDAVIKILGEKVIFELNFLLIDRAGYMLRHSGMHGKIKDDEFSTNSVKIFWWTIIKLLMEYK